MGVFTRPPSSGPGPGPGPGPSTVRASAAPYSAPRTITASAQRIRLRDQKDLDALRRRNQVRWQRLAWDYYDAVAEIKFAFTLLGSITSRIRLYPAEVSDLQTVPAPFTSPPAPGPAPALPADGPPGPGPGPGAHPGPGTGTGPPPLPQGIKDAATTLLARLSSSRGGQPALLREFTINLSVAGDCSLVQSPASEFPSPQEEDWGVYSTDELVLDANNRPAIRPYPDSRPNEYRVIPANAFVGRVYRSHPRWSGAADSSMIGVLELCSDLLLLTRAARATARSRLNAGAFYIPDGLSAAAAPPAPPLSNSGPAAPGAPDPVPAPPDDDPDEFEEELIAAMMEPISDEESAAAVVPMLIRGPAELGDKIKQFKFERSFDPALAERADRLLERILQGIDVPKEVITGLANVKYALSGDAEILTRSGWRTHEHAQVGEDVYTLNHATGMGEWQPLLDVSIHDHDGPMLRMESITHSSLSTPEHRWAVVKTGRKVAGPRRRWTTSGGGFSSTDRVETAAECANLPKEAKWSDDFVRLVALYMSDGHLEAPARGRMRANITKTARNRNPGALSSARAVAASIDPEHREYPCASSTPDGRSVEGVRFRLSPGASEALLDVVGGAEKVVRCDWVSELTFAQLALFLDSLIDIGDGNLVNGRADIRRYWQTDRRRLEPVALAAVLAGWAVRWLPAPITPGADALIGSSRPCWGLTVTRARTWFQPRAGNSVWEHYQGKVWCPTTSNGTWLARQSGKVFFTGNSNALVIDENLYKAHIEPMALTISDAITTMWVRPALRELDFPEDQVRRVAIWYDPSEVVMKPDKSAPANEGYDRFLISGRAWRAAHGFSESDAPSGDELAYRMLVDKGTILPETAELLLTHYAPDAMGAIRQESAAASGNALPPEVQQALGGTPSPAAPPAAPAAPAPEPAPEPAAPEPEEPL